MTLHPNQLRRVKELSERFTPRNVAAIMGLDYEAVRAAIDKHKDQLWERRRRKR